MLICRLPGESRLNGFLILRSFAGGAFAHLHVDVVDMEAFAIAKVCKLTRVNFSCYKYVTDSADENASHDWQKLVAKGEKEYIKIIEQQKIQLY